MKCLLTALSHSFIVALWLSSAHAQGNCERPTLVDALGDIKYSHLALKTRSGGPYVIDKPCVILYRGEFAKVLPFVVLPLGSGSATAALYIKSYKTFTSNPPDKIKLSRNDGWFFSDSPDGTVTARPALDDKRYPGTVADWNVAHSTIGTPLDFEKRLHVFWHAYADGEKNMPSTDEPSYWATKPDFDFAHGTLTAYLLRFLSNSETAIPFQVYLQDEVQQIDLIIDSNVEALSSEYKFIIH